ncbi:MAG: hypothetical protein IKW51_11075 [Bacteroidales bacterium]|nr:hypothetical protein [Bacteroidales bacterium]
MKRLLSFFLLLLSFVLDAQDYVVVSDIVLEGNKVTKPSIIMKELTFGVGDTIDIARWDEQMRVSRENIQNTSLFNFVDFECVEDKNSDNSLVLNIKLTERWYIWAYPYVAYADRNINAWYEADDIRRFSYGVDMEYKNLWGLKHNLTFTFISGYNQNYGFTYDIPYVVDKYNVGLKYGAAYMRDKEVAYITEANKISYYKSENDFAKHKLNFSLEPYYRLGHRNRLFVKLAYDDISYQDTLAVLNEDFSNANGSRFQYFTLTATFKNDYRDEQNYPLYGHYFELLVEKNGLGFFETSPDVLYGKITADWYRPIRGRWYWASNVTMKLSDDADAPYFLNQGLGYKNDYVRTYELYVVDAMNFALLKNNLKYAILNPLTRYIPFIKNERFGKIHFALYANVFFDCAYSWNMPENKSSFLDDKFIYGTGLGLDFVTYYDKVLRLEYGINDMGESGLFVHFVAPI